MPPLNGRTLWESAGVSASLIPAAAPASVSSTRAVRIVYIPITGDSRGRRAAFTSTVASRRRNAQKPVRVTFESLMRSLALLSLLCFPLLSQNNYEIQVYPYETVAPHSTMVELH